MSIDLNGAPEQRSIDLIPDGTIATLHVTIRPGNAGPDGWLKRSKDGGSEALDCELTVVDGPHVKRKLWELMTVAGTTEGHAKASEISGAKLRAILESARGIRPDDGSDTAREARRVNSYGDFDGLRFIAKIGIEKGKDGYKDKNRLTEVITPDRQGWKKIEQVTQPIRADTATAEVASTKPITKPAWAGHAEANR